MVVINDNVCIFMYTENKASDHFGSGPALS